MAARRNYPVGERAFSLLHEATRNAGVLMLGTTRADNARTCAMKRLVRDGLFLRHTFGSTYIGFTTLYAITPDGRAIHRREAARGIYSTT